MEMPSLPRGIRLSRERIIGLVLAAVGVILLVLSWSAQMDIDEIGATNDPVLQHEISMLEDRRDICLTTGVGVVFIGVFALALLSEPSTPTVVVEGGMISSAKMASETLGVLSLPGNASYLPALHGLTKERVFIPAKEGLAAPPSALSDDMLLSPGKDGSTPGILLEPFGLSLLDRIEKELGVSVGNAGIEAAEGTLQIMKHGLNIMKDFHFKERDGKTILRVEYGGLRDACGVVRREKPDTCRQAACVGCSCLLTAAARATGKRIAVEDVDNKQETVVFTLSLQDW